MNFKKKLLPVLAASALLIFLAASGIFIRESGTASAKSSRYENLDSFTEVMYLIERNYVEPVENKTLVDGAIKGMLQGLDPHSTYFTEKEYKDFQVETKGEFGGLGITIGMRDNILTVIAPIEDTPAFRAGLKSGDRIIKIEDNSTTGLSLEDAVNKLRGKPGTNIAITIHRDNVPKPFDVTLTRAIIKVKAVKSDMIGKDVAYIRVTQFKEDVSGEIKAAIEQLRKNKYKGIIVDLRNNPGGLLTEAINVSSIFLPSGKEVVYTKDRTGKDQHFKSSTFTLREEKTPLVLLVNEGSASASEILAGAIQDYKRGILVGKKTYGKASVQSIIPLRDGSAVKLTTAKYYTPKGRMIHDKGIEPDLAVEDVSDNVTLTQDEIDKLAADISKPVIDMQRDEQLKAAVEKLREMIKNG
ncbi:S41 family peptidase [Geovibrio thiophilus]|uniref:S41 family peptidase n=1 Tax=Geovibrio thiophilus TaxID=139438 RepID=A0A410JXL8_9BACT|nr:S41 family peptidase [Geovibrio thiophilus]QAR32910.1 S41 family peptidase [Geovibrio thiophilus]